MATSTYGGGMATPYNSPQRYYVDRGSEFGSELINVLHKMGAYIGNDMRSHSYIVECDSYTWAKANEEAEYRYKRNTRVSQATQAQSFYGSIADMSYGGAVQSKPVPPPHKCLAGKCKDSQIDFYQGVLNYHKLNKPEAKLHDCGNIMCLIEQIKK